MTLFDSILANHHLEKCPLPLWRIKVTDDEYEELKRTLSKETRILGKMPFMGLARECTLLYAEYWRREYTEGTHSKQMVFKSLPDANPYLNIRGERLDMCELLYQAARNGAKKLGIEILSFEKAHYVESMLYQGGLPMKLIVGSDSNGLWERFVRGLVFKNINFDELNLGTVATNSTSMRMYCNQICDAVDAKQYLLLPFYAEDENNPWYEFLITRFKSVRRTQRMAHPFSIDWEFCINSIDKTITSKYDLKGVQKLSDVFIEQHHLNNLDSISVNVLRNGKVVDVFDYYNAFCRYEVRSKRAFRNGDVISLYIHNQEQPHITGSIDMDTPHLLYRYVDGTYHMGNMIGKEESFLFIPDNWNVEEPPFEITEYYWNDIILRGMKIPSEYTNEIKLYSDDGIIIYGGNNIIYWTELTSAPLAYLTYVDEPVYDVNKARFALCHDGSENVVKQLDRPIEFRSKWDKEWTNSPSYGEIFVRAKSNDDIFVTPTKVLNVGDGLKIQILEADGTSCKIQVYWPFGKVGCECGTKQIDNTWQIKKDDCDNKNKIPFSFTPEHNHQNAFTLHVKAPFKEFSIEDENGNTITNGSVIPYADVDKYQYHLVGLNIRKMQFGKEIRSLKWNDGTLYMRDGNNRIQLSYEGNLSRLFGSREIIETMLDKTALSMLEAEVPVTIELSDNTTMSFSIRKAPYRPIEKNGNIYILCNYKPIEYKHTLKLLSLDKPTTSPIDISYSNENGYVVPDMIREWGKTLVIGRTRGRICPTMIDLTQELTQDVRKQNRDTAIARINDELESSTIGDATWLRILSWFDNCQKYDIPASSLLDLLCIANNQDYLIRFAFQLWATKEDKELLIDQLYIFSKDLAFQWFWLTPKTHKGIFKCIEMFIDDPKCPFLLRIFSQWAINKGKTELLYTINTDDYYNNIVCCIKEVIAEFTEWFKKLCYSSAIVTYNTNEINDIEYFANNIVYDNKKLCYSEVKGNQYVEVNQDNLDENTRLFFEQYSEDGKAHNEAWMYKRVNILHKHLVGEVDIFTMKPKVRRSIIFCYQATTHMFLIALNNKLIIKNY